MTNEDILSQFPEGDLKNNIQELIDEGVSKRCILFFYKQNPDFHKPGLCHVQKNLYL